MLPLIIYILHFDLEIFPYTGTWEMSMTWAQTKSLRFDAFSTDYLKNVFKKTSSQTVDHKKMSN